MDLVVLEGFQEVVEVVLEGSPTQEFTQVSEVLR